MEPQLDLVERRVLGSLIEKALTTPEYYPLTLNSLRTACNQKSNRYPVLELDDDDVFLAVSRLRRKDLLESVYTDGSRVERFRHRFTERFTVTGRQLAILCELLIRGPQTAGELNSRASRMAQFGSATQVAEVLDRLADSPVGPMVVKLARKPGQKDSRWAHLFSDPEETTASKEEVDAAGRAEVGSSGTEGWLDPGQHAEVGEQAVLLKKTEDNRVVHLEQQVDSLRREIRALNERFEGFRKQLDEISAQLPRGRQ